jgi:6-pyruvoyltetrahydropterin/6-carboxytetrahydropterin synthase
MPGVYEIFVNGEFSATHRLEGYDGPCARVHGHNWGVVAHVQCRELGPTGMGMDFLEVKKALDALVARLDHADLNALPELAGVCPTAEVLARHIFRALSDALNGPAAHVAKVTVTETKDCGASYWED